MTIVIARLIAATVGNPPRLIVSSTDTFFTTPVATGTAGGITVSSFVLVCSFGSTFVGAGASSLGAGVGAAGVGGWDVGAGAAVDEGCTFWVVVGAGVGEGAGAGGTASRRCEHSFHRAVTVRRIRQGVLERLSQYGPVIQLQ